MTFKKNLQFSRSKFALINFQNHAKKLSNNQILTMSFRLKVSSPLVDFEVRQRSGFDWLIPLKLRFQQLFLVPAN